MTSTGRLDVDAFVPFRELLEACQDFAEHSGCRFQRRVFEAQTLPSEGQAMEAANRKAAPMVAEFTRRVQARDQELMDCVERAYRFVMAESVRSGIVATCREVGLWPPPDPPKGVPEDDCSYQDTTAPLPVIAQRAYNDEVQRLREASLQPLVRRAMTASFLVDFVGEAGAPPPVLSESHLDMLREFMLRVEEWAAASSAQVQPWPAASSPGGLASAAAAAVKDRAQQALLQGLGLGTAADVARQEVLICWTKNWETPAGTLLNVAAVGLAVAAGVATLRRATRPR